MKPETEVNYSVYFLILDFDVIRSISYSHFTVRFALARGHDSAILLCLKSFVTVDQGEFFPDTFCQKGSKYC